MVGARLLKKARRRRERNSTIPVWAWQKERGEMEAARGYSEGALIPDVEVERAAAEQESFRRSIAFSQLSSE